MREQRASSDVRGTRLTAPEIYQSIRADGDDELRRPPGSLWWSGVAAGIALGVSLVAKAVLHNKLPENDWRPLLENFGYTIGFLIVVLGRMQLFTENTITVILPLAADRTRRVFWLTLRLWLVVFAANLVGTLIAALFADFGFIGGDQLAAMQEVARALLDKGWLDTLLQGVPAGFLIAAMVWMLPNSRGFEIWVIVLTTYLIGLGGFTHVIVSSVEAFLLLLNGELGLLALLGSFLLPAFIGNVLGGTALFSLLAWGQVRQEIE